MIVRRIQSKSLTFAPASSTLSVAAVQQLKDLISRLEPLGAKRNCRHDNRMCGCRGAGAMSYAEFCQDQASDCARRARLARSAQIAAYYQDLGWRWLRLAEQAQETGGALGK
jgi:hypothetical protein